MLKDNIKRLRLSRGLNQVQFAERLNVTQGSVSHWETGRAMPDTYQLLRIAKAFDITVDELTEGEDVVPADLSEPQDPPAPPPLAPHEEAEAIMQHLLAELRGLPDSEYDNVVKYIRFLKQNSDEKK